MAIKITTSLTEGSLQGKSHWWGFPDLPDGVEFPLLQDNDEDYDGEGELLMTFICQIKLDEIAGYDEENLLPHKGMLYFFADLDYFLGDMEAPAEGLGFWPQEAFKVIYSPEDKNLNTHITINEDGEAACLCDEAISLKPTEAFDYGHKLLGMPFFEEVHEAAPEYISLLQIDEDERWSLRFYDCGMLNFLIRKEDLAARRFDAVRLYFHCM